MSDFKYQIGELLTKRDDPNQKLVIRSQISEDDPRTNAKAYVCNVYKANDGYRSTIYVEEYITLRWVNRRKERNDRLQQIL